MSNNDAIELEGTVIDLLGGGDYKVLIEEMDLEVTAYAAGKMKKHNIKIIPGDKVKVELSPYEPTKGRIVYRSINKSIDQETKSHFVHESPPEVSSEDDDD